jgi:hypothetical protein
MARWVAKDCPRIRANARRRRAVLGVLGRVGRFAAPGAAPDLGAVRGHPRHLSPVQMEAGVDGGCAVPRLPRWGRSTGLPPPDRGLRHRHAHPSSGAVAPLPWWAEGDAVVGWAVRPPQPSDASLASAPAVLASGGAAARYAPELNPVEPLWANLKGWSCPTWPATPWRRSPPRPSAASNASATPTTWVSRSCRTAACPYGEQRASGWNAADDSYPS